MSRRLVAPFAAILFALVGGVAPALAQSGQAEPTPVAKAYILVDADSGAVLAAVNPHEPLFVASLTKVMTAFTTLEQLQLSYELEISPLTASKPAMRIGMQAGQRWTVEQALYSLLMVSANDAAYAMAEGAGGSVAEFSALMQRTADRLGMKDSRWLDPSGLDGSEGYGGGTKASAYDLAVVSRNALEVPEIAKIVGLAKYDFTGGDGQPHSLSNHNKMLGLYPGATGMKTGYTRAAGHSLIASAERDGRRLIAVVIGATGSSYDVASMLLDQGFNTAPESKGVGEVLPPASFSRAKPPVVEKAAATEAPPAPAEAGTSTWSAMRRPLTLLLLVLAVAFFARREQIKRRKRRRRMMRRAYLDAKRRGMIDVIDAERYYGLQRAPRDGDTVRPQDDLWPPREIGRSHVAHRRGRHSSMH